MFGAWWRRVIGPVAVAAAIVSAGQASSGAAVVASIPLPHGVAAISEVDAAGSIWSLVGDLEGGYVYRIDPATNRITDEIDLPSGSPTGNFFYPNGMVAGYGSLWVAETFRDEILRIDPVTARVVRRIATGRYPAYLAAGGGSIWVAQDEAGDVARIDPGSNAVVATIPVGRQDGTGRDQPFDLTWDPGAARLLVTLPFTHRVAVVDGASQRVHNLAVAPALACGRAIVVPGGFWLDDTPCSNDMYRWGDAARAITAHISVTAPFNSSFGGVASGAVLYVGEQTCNPSACHRGTLAKHDATTGALLATRPTASPVAYLPAIAAGDLWVADYDQARLVRVRHF